MDRLGNNLLEDDAVKDLQRMCFEDVSILEPRSALESCLGSESKVMSCNKNTQVVTTRCVFFMCVAFYSFLEPSTSSALCVDDPTLVGRIEVSRNA